MKCLKNVLIGIAGMAALLLASAVLLAIVAALTAGTAWIFSIQPGGLVVAIFVFWLVVTIGTVGGIADCHS